MAELPLVFLQIRQAHLVVAAPPAKDPLLTSCPLASFPGAKHSPIPVVLAQMMIGMPPLEFPVMMPLPYVGRTRSARMLLPYRSRQKQQALPGNFVALMTLKHEPPGDG